MSNINKSLKAYMNSIEINVGMSWEMVKLSSVIEKPISGEWGIGDGSIKVIRSTNFTNDGTLDFSNVVCRDIPLSKVNNKKLKSGDIIIEKSGGSPTQPVGRVVHFLEENQEYLCNNFTSVLRPKEYINSRYLFWCLFSGHINGGTLKYQNKTTGIINLQLERYCNEFEIPLPPLATQRRIAEILDAADALKRKDQQLLKKYDELAQAIFIDMFGDPVKNEKGWEVKSIGSITSVGSGGTPSRQEPSYFEGEINWVKTTEVNGEIINTTEELITTEGLKNSSCKIYAKDSVIIAMYGQGKTRGQVGMLGVEAATNQACAVISPCKSLNPIFLFNYLKFSYKELRSLGRGGNQENLNKGMIEDFLVIIPPMTTQKKFNGLIDTINYQQKKVAEGKSNSLFQTLIQKAFNGELVN